MQSPSVDATVKGLQREGESQQQISVLPSTLWEQLLDYFNYGALARMREQEDCYVAKQRRAQDLVGLRRGCQGELGAIISFQI